MLPPYIASGVVKQTTPEVIYRAMLLCRTVRQTTSGYFSVGLSVRLHLGTELYFCVVPSVHTDVFTNNDSVDKIYH